MSVSTDCASAMASNPHADTSSRSNMVPISLRVRMDKVVLLREDLRRGDPDYMVRAVTCKQAIHVDPGHNSEFSTARHAALAARRGGDDFSHAFGRRRQDRKSTRLNSSH